MDGRSGVFIPAFSGFFGIYRNGDRVRAYIWPRAARKFPTAISCLGSARFLAPLAHFIVEFSARLPLHSAWRQPSWSNALCFCDVGYDGPLRIVAWSRLDVRGLGLVARNWPHCVPGMAAA